MMDRGTVRNMYSFISKINFRKLVHLVGFIIRKFVTMHGHMNVKFGRKICYTSRSIAKLIAFCICNKTANVKTLWWQCWSAERHSVYITISLGIIQTHTCLLPICEANHCGNYDYQLLSTLIVLCSTYTTYVCSVQFSQHAEFISLNSSKAVIFITETECCLRRT
jgi:hypothetical protein